MEFFFRFECFGSIEEIHLFANNEVTPNTRLGVKPGFAGPSMY